MGDSWILQRKLLIIRDRQLVLTFLVQGATTYIQFILVFVLIDKGPFCKLGLAAFLKASLCF